MSQLFNLLNRFYLGYITEEENMKLKEEINLKNSKEWSILFEDVIKDYQEKKKMEEEKKKKMKI